MRPRPKAKGYKNLVRAKPKPTSKSNPRKPRK